MSRRTKPRTPAQRAAFAWPIVVFGVILIAASIFLLSRGGDTGGSPQIVVDQQAIDFGYVKYGDARAFEIRVSNAGDGTLRFKEKPYIEVLEGC